MASVAIKPSAAFQLADSEKLFGQGTWDDFVFVFPQLLANANLWDVDAPLISCPLFAITRNIDKVLWPLIRTATNGKEGWDCLLKAFSSPTTNSKMLSIGRLLNSRPTMDIPASLDNHSKTKRLLLASFGQTVSIESLADLIFTNFLPEPFSTFRAVEQAKENFDFPSLEKAILAEHSRVRSYASTAEFVSPPKSLDPTACPHTDNASTCYKCNPCKKCTAAGNKYTWHSTTSCTARNAQKKKPSAAFVNSNQVNPEIFAAAYQAVLSSLESSNKPQANLVVSFTPDSGCSDHMVSNKGILELYRPSPLSVSTADGFSNAF